MHVGYSGMSRPGNGTMKRHERPQARTIAPLEGTDVIYKSLAVQIERQEVKAQDLVYDTFTVDSMSSAYA